MSEQIENNDRQRRSSSAKFGRRAQGNSEGNPKQDLDSTQEELEKYWKGLREFRQFHKGRLDSANNEDDLYCLGDFGNILSPTSENEHPTYSPSVLENHVPTRSKSQMSNPIVPFYVYENIKQATENSELNVDTKKKSKSNEDLHSAFERDNIAYKSAKTKADKSISDYKVKIAKENNLREQMIKELLLENENISKKLLKSSAYNRMSKYKSLAVVNNAEVITQKKRHEKQAEEVFIIPELPRGRVLKIYILSTWGDRYYVGLNGIEIFGDNGSIVNVSLISASPSDVNILPECLDDPRVVKNLLNGINRTQDDVHLWLTPFNEGEEHTVTIEFEEEATLAMIRIWNYNKSRIHSYRGVKDIIMTLDETTIFKGEIAKACGGMLGGVDAFGDTILFTTDEEILERISKNDSSYYSLTTSQPSVEVAFERPPTALNTQNRPVTGGNRLVQAMQKHGDTSEEIVFGGNRLELILVENWGSRGRIGLSGVCILGEGDKAIEIGDGCVDCKCGKEEVTRLVNGDNITTDVGKMWCVAWKHGQEISVGFNFAGFVYVSGLKIWNYNESLETTYCGVRSLKIKLDDNFIINPYTNSDLFFLRRAPGNTHYDFVQDIKFTATERDITNEITLSGLKLDDEELYEYPSMPQGFVFQFIIFSTWGDQYYCGLNGLELYDHMGRQLILEQHNICAHPESINVLPNVSGDIRTPDKLIDGVNCDHSGSHSWLAPIIPKHLNRIYVVLDQPTYLSRMRLWNYSKTVSRGVKEFGVLVDDLLIYNGILDKFNNKKGVINYRDVIFSGDENLKYQERGGFVKQTINGQEILLLNESLRTTTGGSLPSADQALRPFTAVSPFSRGFTSFSH